MVKRKGIFGHKFCFLCAVQNLNLKIMTCKQLGNVLILIVTLGLAHANATPVTYTFVPVSNDFNSKGFGGSITLDVSSSSSGTTADINSEQFNSATEFLTMDSTNFSWTSTLITQMNVSVRQKNGSSYVFSVYDNGLYEAGMDAQAFGSWVASSSNVPEAANTSLLLGFALVVLAAFRYRSNLPLAVARR
jgi:hypothetical protein